MLSVPMPLMIGLNIGSHFCGVVFPAFSLFSNFYFLPFLLFFYVI